MSEPILSVGALLELAQIAETAMQTPVTINRRETVNKGTSIVADDLGDDEVTYEETSESKRTVVYGSFSSTPTPVQQELDGQLVTVNTYKLALPVGTDILPGDEVLVGNDVYAVSDTTGESTWQALVLASLRKVE